MEIVALIISLATRKDGIEISIVDYEKLHYDSLLLPEFFNFSKHNFPDGLFDSIEKQP